ncbi:hypothetical protein LFE_0020 [Leptospirillum ferrooxidans C2-3]|uniref:Uncharacterized protein n=1 Tax=Leptospirillum ferrooxidans (strain C2-3) TaxID=1162668 RepID=I0IKF2_LEPFC|nr:hypothetical protein LFE_0020 [Leptospirillum ferrooxidans C2-3]
MGTDLVAKSFGSRVNRSDIKTKSYSTTVPSFIESSIFHLYKEQLSREIAAPIPEEAALSMITDRLLPYSREGVGRHGPPVLRASSSAKQAILSLAGMLAHSL